MIFTGIFGTIDSPAAFGGYQTLEILGLTAFLTNLINLLIIIAGLFTLANFISAGYLYMSSNGEPQKLMAAGNKMLQSVIGLLVIAAAFIIAGLIGWIFFNNALFLFMPVLSKISP
ncbi:MAG: hypothetical protein UV54_C0038G0004 [Candidatus Beckwithbacteria bacterium GW2011_GWA2_43_10]|uniref:Integral membrane protein n=1 Tax=Candidatus Beckwithbacteria bacterium GW2011_GWA2_43_10 TaxID=1618369 RepID=A0A0G1C0Z3_9BACT|nr:MAG: hypothetical protein UV54_C0038G0004 [Candidatus Beckwithbacteria bacterium GW2011_GWA2_43_10]